MLLTQIPTTCIILAILVSACQATTSKSSIIPLTLKKSTFADIDEIDTVDIYDKKGMYLLQLKRNGHLGDYSITYGIEKQMGPNPGDKLRYEADQIALYKIPAKHNLWFWYDKNFLLLMDREIADNGIGWFRIRNGRKVGWDIIGDKANQIVDSLIKLKKGSYKIDERKKMLEISRNDTLLYKIATKNLTAKYELSNYNNLDYGLYKRINDSLILISKNPDDIFKCKDGIYFIPKPGYGVRSKYLKMEIFRLVDSVSKISSPPSELKIEPVI